MILADRRHTSHRILVVGGGISGLSIAARLAQAGLAVTVLEASQKVGAGASTRNQGWLYSGAWFAPEQTELARMCHRSLRQTIRFCPECLEPDSGSMVYLMTEADTDPARWTSAWEAAEIPYEALTPEALFARFPQLAISEARHGYQLPDVAIRTDILLRRLAEAAERAGAELRTGTAVKKLVQVDDSVEGLETASGETIRARLVILAGNAQGGALFPGFGTEAVGPRRELALVVLKTHLIAIEPQIGRWPLCVVDAEGFNHLPHRPRSVFGSNRWIPVRYGEDDQVEPAEIDRIWNRLSRFFPDLRREDHAALQWAGSTVQPLPVDKIEPGEPPMPTVIDHEDEDPQVKNLLSIFPGRASLWAPLAEQAQQIVLQKLDAIAPRVATPPWD